MTEPQISPDLGCLRFIIKINNVAVSQIPQDNLHSSNISIDRPTCGEVEKVERYAQGFLVSRRMQADFAVCGWETRINRRGILRASRSVSTTMTAACCRDPEIDLDGLVAARDGFVLQNCAR
jgi:hypothetical protein